jgi:predicted Kef-type K+ transport protein
MLPVWFAGAFVLGLAARQVGLPPLVGFLVAGFLFRALGYEGDERLAQISELGVLLLLFTVGLKVRLQNIIRPEVWGTALVHLGLVAAVAGWFLVTGAGLSLAPALALAAGLGFSSTVLAAKVLETKRELRSFHGRVAIGILIVQDIVAVAILAANGGHSPSPFAVGLVLLALARPMLTRLLEFIGHGELLLLYGIALALTVGALGFESLGLSPELGALVLGTLLADHPKAKELGDALWGLKEILLVGFFLNIGLSALPTWEMAGFAALMVLALPLKGGLFFGLLVAFGLRARTSFLASLSLTTYSEFGLIVTGFGVSSGVFPGEWLVIAALAVSMSFAIAAPLNRSAHRLYKRLEPVLVKLESAGRSHPDDQPVSLGASDVIIVGMGRIGASAYDHMLAQGHHVVGLDSDPAKLQRHRADGRRIVFADAEDPGFWHRLNIDRIRAVLLAVPDLEAKIISAEQLRQRGYRGLISSMYTYSDERERILDAGCTVTYSNFDEAGVGFASHAEELMQAASLPPVPDLPGVRG